MTDRQRMLPPPEAPSDGAFAEDRAAETVEPVSSGRRLRSGDNSKRILLSLMLTGASIAYVFDQTLRRTNAEAAIAVAGARSTGSPVAVAAAPGDPPVATGATSASPAPAGTSPAERFFAGAEPPTPLAARVADALAVPVNPPDPPAADRNLDPRPNAEAAADGQTGRTPVPAPLPRNNPLRNGPRTDTAQVTPGPAQSVLVRPKFRDGVYLGPSVNAYFGVVQVQVTIAGGKVAQVEAVDYPADRNRSRRINDQALPMLRTEVIRGQSADVDIISGATLTSVAYARSLASALSQSRL